MCFSRCIFLQLEAQSVKKIGKKKRKKCKINAKVQTEMQPELQQSNDADTSCKKKQRWDRQSSRCKKMPLGQGIAKKTKQPPNCKKNAMWQTKCKKKRCDRQSVKKSDGTGKVQKKCNCGQFVASRIWERQPTGWNHKTTTSSTFFFPCVSLCVDLHTPLLLKQWSGQHDVSNSQHF